MWIVRIAITLIWAVFLLWTLRYLFGARFRRGNPEVYALGVKGFGLTFWGAEVLVLTVVLSRSFPLRPWWYHFLWLGFLTLPVCLWIGYGFQTVMSFFAPSRR